MTAALVVRPGALGDALLTLPLVEALLSCGAGRIAILGAPKSWAFLKPEQRMVDVLDFDGREWLGLFGAAPLGARARARLAGVETAILLLGRGQAGIERALRSSGFRHCVHAVPAVHGEAAAEPWTDDRPSPRFVPWPPGPPHAARRLVAALEALAPFPAAAAWPAAPRGLSEHPLLAPAQPELDRVLAALGLEAPLRRGILVLHPGSGGTAKCWPTGRFAALAGAAFERWKLDPVFVLGPADKRHWPILVRTLPKRVQPRALIERPLREVLALLSIARAYVGNDSGISHLAARATASLVLFGPTDPRIWHPLGPRVAILRAPAGRLDALPVAQVLEGLAVAFAGDAAVSP